MSAEDFREARNLTDTLLDVHRQAYLDLLQNQGFEATEWDAQQLAEFEDLTTLDKFIPAHVVYSGNLHVSPAPLLGATYFRPCWSGTADEYLESHIIPGNPDTDHRYTTVADIDAPLKHIQLELHESTSIRDNRPVKVGHVFIGPDMPPLAVHEDDIEYLHRPPYAVTATSTHYGLTVIHDVEQAFGEEAVEKLPAGICRAIAESLRTNNPHCEPFVL